LKIIKYSIIAFFILITFNTIVKILAREKQKIDFVRVNEADIDKKEVEAIKKRTYAIITKTEKEVYNIVEKIDYTHKKDIQKQIKNEFGVYIGLRFESLFKNKIENSFMNEIYIFKVDFESKKDVEIRVYINNKKEIIDLNVMSWEKEYFSYL